MYSVLIYKSTRIPVLSKSQMDLPDAIKNAETLYDQFVVLNRLGYLASGVTVVVMRDDLAAIAIEKGALPPLSENSLVHQCGGY